jgi:hypothetical protein
MERPFTTDAFILLDHSDWTDSEGANNAAEDDYGEPQ